MPLFDDCERTDRSPSPISEDQFTFLNRSARADAVNIRAELERWFDRYPAAEQSDLRSKFRDPRPCRPQDHSTYLLGTDNTEIVHAVHERPAPMFSATNGLRLPTCS